MCCVVRLLENELQRVKKASEHREKELRQQLTELKEDNDRQQKLIGQVCLFLLLLSLPSVFRGHRALTQCHWVHPDNKTLSCLHMSSVAMFASLSNLSLFMSVLSTIQSVWVIVCLGLYCTCCNSSVSLEAEAALFLQVCLMYWFDNTCYLCCCLQTKPSRRKVCVCMFVMWQSKWLNFTCVDFLAVWMVGFTWY